MKKNYQQTKIGLINHMYANQKYNSVERGHTPPGYSVEDFRDLLLTRHHFHDLFDLWELSGFNKNKTPSIDRLDDYTGYTLANIQLVTWEFNKDKYHSDCISGKNTKLAKAVNQRDKETGLLIQEHFSINSAERLTGVLHQHIIRVCKGKRKSAGGFIWEYA